MDNTPNAFRKRLDLLVRDELAATGDDTLNEAQIAELLYEAADAIGTIADNEDQPVIDADEPDDEATLASEGQSDSDSSVIGDMTAQAKVEDQDVE